DRSGVAAAFPAGHPDVITAPSPLACGAEVQVPADCLRRRPLRDLGAEVCQAARRAPARARAFDHPQVTTLFRDVARVGTVGDEEQPGAIGAEVRVGVTPAA